ncbi:MAG: hypothetical protein PHY99_02920 [Bacteroidales bacterium]|nr:hypothetical protein [Bacteroidales bacterium]
MKAKIFIPLMLVVFCTGTMVSMGQEVNQKKIDRINKKIEKQSKKLHKLYGEKHADFKELTPFLDQEKQEEIRDEVMEKMEESREARREAMESYRDAMEKAREELAEQKEAFRDQLRDMKEMQLDVYKDLNGKKYHYYFKTPKLELGTIDTLSISPQDFKIDFPVFKGEMQSLIYGQDVLNIEKKLNGETITADFNYDVKPGSGGMNLSVNGTIDSGKVGITIKKPDGSVFNEYTLSPLANVNWHQTLSFDDDVDSFTGKWIVTIAAENAKGEYSIRISSR